MCLIDVVRVYLYGSIDNNIFMKILEEFKFPKANSTKLRSMYLIKSKQSRYMWYNFLSAYLLKRRLCTLYLRVFLLRNHESNL